MTWFRKIENVYWINKDEFDSDEKIIKNLKYYLATFGIFL